MWELWVGGPGATALEKGGGIFANGVLQTLPFLPPLGAAQTLLTLILPCSFLPGSD